MTDPLDALRAPLTPADPDPAFATDLRARLERALALPRGVAVTDTTTPDASAVESTYRHGDVGYAWLSVPDVERAVAFYGVVLGWRVAPGSDPQGRQVLDRSPHLGLHGGNPRGTLNCCYAVQDVLQAVERVRAAGGRAAEPRSEPYGLVADCVDDQGMVFAVYQPPGGVGTQRPAAGGGEGDLVYVTYEVMDSARARAFYGELLGWTFTPGRVEDGWQVVGGSGGLQGGHPRAAAVPMWRVPDLAGAVERVRAAGGTATDPVIRPYGGESECADDQGTRFYLGQL